TRVAIALGRARRGQAGTGPAGYPNTRGSRARHRRDVSSPQDPARPVAELTTWFNSLREDPRILAAAAL
ncbi:MAG: hypothetical protein ABI629_16540, partial [bacterium]